MRKKLAILGLLRGLSGGLLAGLLATAVIPAFAAKRMTVEELQQIVAADVAAHHSDDAVAQQLAGVSLAERLSFGTLRALESSSPGPNTTQALQVLADESAFLDPPAREIPSRPTPNIATQKVILSMAVNYVVHTVPTLPNFLATRDTESFSDLQPVQGAGQLLGGMYSLRTVHVPITFRDGRESDAPILPASTAQKGASPKGAKRPEYVSYGLASWGEFGPILGIVLVDAGKGQLGWARWEDWNGKPVAVFRFSVEKPASHYNLQYWRDANGNVIGSRYASFDAVIDSLGQKSLTLVRETEGYHGTLTVDPGTGTILQIGIQADMPAAGDVKRADMMVEYGQAKIGDSAFTCPVHSVTAFASEQQVQTNPTAPFQRVQELELNDVAFTGYRRFGSESTLILNPPESENQPAVASTEAGTGAASPSPASSVAAAAAPPDSSGQPAAAAATPTPAAAAPAPAPAEEQEMVVSAAKGLPGVEPDAAGSGNSAAGNSQSSFTLKVTTRLVDVGLVATDKHGKPITDLKPEEIELYDNGHKLPLAAFNRAGSPTAPAPPQTDTFTNAHATQEGTAPDLLIVLLDESHLPFNDLNRARGEVLRFLKTARPDSRLALYSIGEHGFRVIQDVTVDHTLAEATLTKWVPSAAGVAKAAELDERNHQQFDTVRNPDDLAYVNGNETPIPDGITTTDPNLRQMGDNPLGQVLFSMIALARHFGSVPGHKSLAWISGDSALFNWNDRAVGIDSKVDNTGSAINRTKEALNDAHISLYAIDASILSVGGAAVDPSLYAPGVQVNPVATCNSAPGGCGTNRIGETGRATAQMQEDTRAIQAPIRLLAEATGGRAVNKGGDLQKTLVGIEQEADALYEIAFHPDTPADNMFHTLLLKIPDRKDIRLRYRNGYLYAEEATGTKERFQEVVWSPQDLAGITLTAEAVKAADAATGAPTVKLRIGFPGLALQREQQGPAAGRWTDKLYIFVAQRDDAIRKAEVSGDTLKLSLKQATYDSGMPAGIPYEREVDVKSKLGSVRVIVVDGNSGKMGSVTLPSSVLHP